MKKNRKNKRRSPRLYLQWQRWYAVVRLPDHDSVYKVLRIYSYPDAEFYYQRGQLFPSLQEAEHKAFTLNNPFICNFT